MKQKSLVSHCAALAHLSGHLLEEAAQHAKVYELFVGEEVEIEAKSLERISLAEGTADFSVNRSPFLRVSADLPTPSVTVPSGYHVRVRAAGPCILCRTDIEKIEYLLSWASLVKQPFSQETEESLGRDIKLLNNPLAFQNVPLSNVLEAFRRLNRRLVDADEVVIEQGEPGDAFYIIEKGSAEVWQKALPSQPTKMVAVLGVGDSFGEESLVTDGTRSATVRMRDAGSLLVLDKSDFTELVSDPLVNEVTAEQARELIAGGYAPLDVRSESEQAEGHLAGRTRFIPLVELRDHIDELPRSTKYLVYSRSGQESAAATLLLSEHGFEAVNLKCGLDGWPYGLEK
ncbi:MAG: cyclic nucleotide-binding domain-containing protein [Pseudomonadota bacterium]